MQEQVTAVEPNGDNRWISPWTSPRARLRRRAAAAKFVYASGAQPLAGYTIKRGVGHGGFGEIYYATSDAGKDVALKLIRRNLDVELRGIRQCLNLKHPNLLRPLRHPPGRSRRHLGGHGVRRRPEPGRRAGRPAPTACRRKRPWPGSTASAPAWPICTTAASSTAT